MAPGAFRKVLSLKGIAHRLAPWHCRDPCLRTREEGQPLRGDCPEAESAFLALSGSLLGSPLPRFLLVMPLEQEKGVWISRCSPLLAPWIS